MTDESLREISRHGSADFPFAYYKEVIHQYQKGYIEWHWHQEFEWVYVLNGSLDCLIELERIHLESAEGLFLNQKTIHRFESKDDATILNVLFLPDFIAAPNSLVYQETIQPVLQSNCRYLAFQQHDQAILDSLKQMMEQSEQGKSLDILVAVLQLWQLFFHTKQDLFKKQLNHHNMLTKARALQMAQFITNNYQNKINLADIAQAGRVSKSEALRCFHQIFQSTPIRFLIEYRLNRARDCLLANEISISQAALESGFDNISHFIRLFKKQFGSTPKQMVQQHRRF